MGNTAHPNRGGDLSLYRPDGLEYKLYMPNMGLHVQYGPSVYIHNIQAYTCLIILNSQIQRTLLCVLIRPMQKLFCQINNTPKLINN